MAVQADLMRRVLRHLFVLRAGEDAEADDAAVVNEAIVSAHQELQTLGLAYWDLTDIPEDVMPGLIRFVAADVAHQFAPDQAMGFEAVRPMAERMIRRVVAMPNENVPIPQRYY